MTNIIKNVDYAIGDLVYLVTDSDQLKRMVIAYEVTETAVLYILSSGEDCSKHYKVEISTEKTLQM